MHHGQNSGKQKNVNFTKIGEILLKYGEFINFVEIGGINNMHQWFRGWMPCVGLYQTILDRPTLRLVLCVAYLVKISQEPVCRTAWELLKVLIASSNPKDEPNDDEETVYKRPANESPDKEPERWEWHSLNRTYLQ